MMNPYVLRGSTSHSIKAATNPSDKGNRGGAQTELTSKMFEFLPMDTVTDHELHKLSATYFFYVQSEFSRQAVKW